MPLDKTRKQMIAARCARSPIWRAVHALGSLDLAMLLLITLTGVCAVATFLESGFSARIARAYVYGSPWFNLWLILLCLNLICSAATRWPFERHHTGFIITHAGIIILLGGDMLFDETADLTSTGPPILSSEGEMERVGDGDGDGEEHHEKDGDDHDDDDDNDDEDCTFAQRKRARRADDHEGGLMEAGMDKHKEDNHMEVEDPIWLAGI